MPDGDKMLIVGAGFIGSRLPEHVLVAAGSVRVVSRTSSAALVRLASVGVEVVIGDIREADVIERVTDRVTRVIVVTGGLMQADAGACAGAHRAAYA